MTDDPYSDHSTGTLRNLLGITDSATLRQVEADLSYAAIVDLGTRSLPGEYDLAHLRSARATVVPKGRSSINSPDRQAGLPTGLGWILWRTQMRRLHRCVVTTRC